MSRPRQEACQYGHLLIGLNRIERITPRGTRNGSQCRICQNKKSKEAARTRRLNFDPFRRTQWKRENELR